MEMKPNEIISKLKKSKRLTNDDFLDVSLWNLYENLHNLDITRIKNPVDFLNQYFELLDDDNHGDLQQSQRGFIEDFVELIGKKTYVDILLNKSVFIIKKARFFYSGLFQRLLLSNSTRNILFELIIKKSDEIKKTHVLLLSEIMAELEKQNEIDDLEICQELYYVLE